MTGVTRGNKNDNGKVMKDTKAQRWMGKEYAARLSSSELLSLRAGSANKIRFRHHIRAWLEWLGMAIRLGWH